MVHAALTQVTRLSAAVDLLPLPPVACVDLLRATPTGGAAFAVFSVGERVWPKSEDQS